jgi:hypothetical protein
VSDPYETAGKIRRNLVTIRNVWDNQQESNVSDARDKIGSRCGTNTGYTAHQRHQEKPCDACAAAKRDYDRRRREAPDKTRQSRDSATAQSRAHTRMRRIYPEVYAALYAEEKELLRRERAAASVAGTSLG